jgi:hypothetical protein
MRAPRRLRGDAGAATPREPCATRRATDPAARRSARTGSCSGTSRPSLQFCPPVSRGFVARRQPRRTARDARRHDPNHAADQRRRRAPSRPERATGHASRSRSPAEPPWTPPLAFGEGPRRASRPRRQHAAPAHPLLEPHLQRAGHPPRHPHERARSHDRGEPRARARLPRAAPPPAARPSRRTGTSARACAERAGRCVTAQDAFATVG